MTPGEDQRRQTVLGLGGVVVPAFFAVMFSACIIGAYHKPDPNNIGLGVVGPPAATAPLRAGMAKAAGSAFDIRPVATMADATHAVRQRQLEAAYLPTPEPA